MCAKRALPVVYDHRNNAHSVEGAREALQALFAGNMPRTVLDVGCGSGTWLKAALDAGARDAVGVDGVEVADNLLQVPRSLVRTADLGRPIDLVRRFDLVLCLEVAEHLEPGAADTLIDSLVAHGDRILFSAAIPGQGGEHHVNCRWPSYWQQLFNGRGFACDDAPRWTIWDNTRIEPWYRQNMMLAVRDEQRAGKEPRISSVVHPAMLDAMLGPAIDASEAAIEQGRKPASWYLTLPFKAAFGKARRAFGGGGATLQLAQAPPLPPS